MKKISIFVLSLLVIQCYSLPTYKQKRDTNTTDSKFPSEASKPATIDTPEIIKTAEEYKDNFYRKYGEHHDRERRGADETDSELPAEKSEPLKEEHEATPVDETKEISPDLYKYELESPPGQLADDNVEIVKQEAVAEPLSEPEVADEKPVEESSQYENPIEESPKAEKPIEESPKYEDSVEESPKAEDSVKESPKAEDSIKESPKAEDFVKETPKAEDSVKESPKYESPVEEPSNRESPATESPKQNTPKIENSIKREKSIESNQVIIDIDAESELRSALGEGDNYPSNGNPVGMFETVFKMFGGATRIFTDWDQIRRMLHTVAVFTGICRSN